ncbi:TRADD-N-associated membrane domain-containing protein [Cryptosporangium phraense]|uniref:Cyanobacterial TRADD-N associated 2 transmembrane domain-containing protein n=1 Tax=Cryptosporangium phraense TaxID=2593070 RepID=A0A545AXM5_9ACTN|nr:hypothetical protein [Cryptosporangium phraense]TQS46086.1 hypothetical protein FL583_06285 [Cryptosporangium phraense]
MAEATTEIPGFLTDRELDDRISDDEHSTRVSARSWGLGLALVGVALGVGGAVVLAPGRDGIAPALPAWAGAAAFLAAAVVVWNLLTVRERTRAERLKERQRSCKQLLAMFEGGVDETVRRLVAFNFQEMDRFVTIALTQAQFSFLASVVAGAAALLVLLGGTTGVLLSDSAATGISTAVLSAVGSMLSGFVSVTFLRTYQMATRQMSYYYGQPLVHCYLLHAEWLAQRFDLESSVKDRLVDATLDASRAAQRHLLDAQRAEIAASAGRRATVLLPSPPAPSPAIVPATAGPVGQPPAPRPRTGS